MVSRSPRCRTFALVLALAPLACGDDGNDGDTGSTSTGDAGSSGPGMPQTTGADTTDESGGAPPVCELPAATELVGACQPENVVNGTSLCRAWYGPYTEEEIGSLSFICPVARDTPCPDAGPEGLERVGCCLAVVPGTPDKVAVSCTYGPPESLDTAMQGCMGMGNCFIEG